MSTITKQIHIRAPVETVWETIIDPDRLHEWVTIHRSVVSASHRPLRQGSTMQQAIHIRGLTFRVNWKLVDVNPPNHAEWAGRGPAHSLARIRYELTDDGDGGTQFDYTNEFSAPGGRLGNVAGMMIVGATSDREAVRSLQKLKALLERGEAK